MLHNCNVIAGALRDLTNWDDYRFFSSLVQNGSVHTIAEDHVDGDLLFVGTEFGLFCTVDGGEHRNNFV